MACNQANAVLLAAYRNGIRHYQELLKTHPAEFEQGYIKERLSACRAALRSLVGPEIPAVRGSDSVEVL